MKLPRDMLEKGTLTPFSVGICSRAFDYRAFCQHSVQMRVRA